MDRNDWVGYIIIPNSDQPIWFRGTLTVVALEMDKALCYYKPLYGENLRSGIEGVGTSLLYDMIYPTVCVARALNILEQEVRQ